MKLFGHTVDHRVHPGQIVLWYRHWQAADAGGGLITVAVGAQHRQAAVKGERGKAFNPRADEAVMGQHEAGQLHPIAGRQCRGQDYVVAVTRTDHQGAGLEARHDFGHRTRAQDGLQHAASRDLALNHHLGAHVAGHVDHARGRQRGVLFDNAPDGHVVQLPGGGGFIEIRCGTVEDDAHHVATHNADLGNQVIGLGDALSVRGAGHQDHVRLQAAGDMARQAGQENPARIRMDALDHQHIGLLGAGRGQADNIFQKFIALAAGDAFGHQTHGQGIGRVLQVADASCEQHRRLGLGRAFGDRLDKRHLQSAPLQRSQQTE